MSTVREPISDFGQRLGWGLASDRVRELLAGLGVFYQISRLDDGSIYFHLYEVGVGLCFEEKVLSTVFIYTKAKLNNDGSMYHPFPIPPIDGLSSTATINEVLGKYGPPEAQGEGSVNAILAQMGQPHNPGRLASTPWLRYQLDGHYLRFAFDALGECEEIQLIANSALTSSASTRRPRIEASEEWEVEHRVDANSERVTLTDEFGDFVVFSRDLTQETPVCVSWRNQHVSDALVSIMVGAQRQALLIQFKADAAIDLETKSLFWIKGGAMNAYELLVDMFVATGEYDHFVFD